MGNARPYRRLHLTYGLVLAAFALVLASITVPGRGPLSGTGVLRTDDEAQGRVIDAYNKLPLTFEANHGQTDAQVQFLSRGGEHTVFLTKRDAVLTLPIGTEATGEDNSWDKPADASTVLRMQLVGANPAPQVVGLNKLPGTSNYFIGSDPQQWHTNVPTYAKVKYRDVYPGIDLIYYGNQRQLEYDFVVAPGGDPDVITLAFQGVDNVSLDRQGNLVLHVGGGEVILSAPVIYQEVDSAKQAVAGGYALHGDARVGFEVGVYDTSRTLVIDPVLDYSTYLGGGDDDEGHGIAVDQTGNVYVTGETFSNDFPTASPVDGTFGGGFVDGFVTKIDSAGASVVYSTYLGGNGTDTGYDIALDSGGNVYITGNTRSTDFPTMSPIQGVLSGTQDAFVTKINASGNGLVYSTYLGGSGVDSGFGIAVNASSSAYITGSTFSSDFPTASAIDGTQNSSIDAFVTKLSADGTSLAYSTYLGGDGVDTGWSIAVGTDGAAYIAGETFSSDFPTMNPIQGTNAGNKDAFVTKLNASGTALAYSTYLGGLGIEQGYGITVDAGGNTYTTGVTYSGNFPTASAFQDTFGGGDYDSFVTKINASGDSLVYSTYLGGSSQDQGNGIAVGTDGNAYVTGFTWSSFFPTANPIQGSNAGGPWEAFVTKFNAQGTGLVYSTYLGGINNERGQAIAVDAAGNTYVTGDTNSDNFPTASAIQDTRAGGQDVFVVKIEEPAPPPPPVPGVSGPGLGGLAAVILAAFLWALRRQRQHAKS